MTFSFADRDKWDAHVREWRAAHPNRPRVGEDVWETLAEENARKFLEWQAKNATTNQHSRHRRPQQGA